MGNFKKVTVTLYSDEVLIYEGICIIKNNKNDYTIYYKQKPKEEFNMAIFPKSAIVCINGEK